MLDYFRGRLIQDLPNLRQLDGEQVTKQERMEVGYVVSSDSEEEEEEEDQEEQSKSAGCIKGCIPIEIFHVRRDDLNP